MANTLTINATSALPITGERPDRAPYSLPTTEAVHNTESRFDTTNGSGRRRRWQNTPGIQVTLNSLNTDDQLSAYQTLHYEGRRSQDSRAQPHAKEEAISRHFERSSSQNSRQVNRLALEQIIKQMSGEGQIAVSGGLLNEQV